MRYVLLIYVQEDVLPNLPEDERNALIQGYAQFHQSVNESGLMSGGAPLQPISNSTTVRIRNNETLITDGPFAETKEQLAGIYILNCKDLDEAIEIAKTIPDVKYGAIEIRPELMIYNDYNG